MTLDLPTVLACLTVASSVLAGAVLTVAVRAKLHRSLTLWGIGLVFNALSYPAFGLRVFGWTTSSIVLTNLLTAVTLVLHTMALMAFQQGRTRPMHPGWLFALGGANVLVAWLFLNDDHWRNVLVAAVQSGLAALLFLQAWGPGLQPPRLTGRLVVITGTGLLLVTLLVRTVFMVLQSDWDGRYKVPDQVQAATYFMALCVLLLNSMGFVLMQMERAISEQQNIATHDGLTGLYNRHALMDALPRYHAQAVRAGTSLALLMIDIDHFKRVNDQYGHLSGDEVLRAVAHRIGERLRLADLLARFGGEEFLVLLPNTDRDGAAVVAENIRLAVESAPFEVRGQAIAVTVSIGVHAEVPRQDATAADAFIAASDQALYAAKRQGRNRVVLSDAPIIEACLST